jgi:hypothetical protein
MTSQAGGVPSFSSLAHSSTLSGNTADNALLSRSVPAYPNHFAQAFSLARNSYPQPPQVVYSSTGAIPSQSILASNTVSSGPPIKLEAENLQPNPYSSGYNSGYVQEFKRYEDNNNNPTAGYYGAYNFVPNYHPKTTNSASGFEPSSPIAAPSQLFSQYSNADEEWY